MKPTNLQAKTAKFVGERESNRCGEVINAQMTKPAGAINLKDPVHLIGVILAGLVILGVIVAIIARFASL